jgi:hypothetical protein
MHTSLASGPAVGPRLGTPHGPWCRRESGQCCCGAIGRPPGPEQRRLAAVRPSRELWLWLGGLFLVLFAFLTAIAIAYFVKEPHYALFGNPWMLGAGICFLAAFTSFFIATRSWPLPPGVKPGFPDITVEILGSGTTETEREGGSGLDVPAYLRSFSARFTSMETGRNANLTVLLYIKLMPGSWGRAGEAVCPPPSWALPPSLGLTPMAMPFALAAGSVISGQLVYEIPRYYLDRISDPLEARLEITEHVSGKSMNIRAELGHYDKNTMTPAAGGAAILGPEYETQEDQHRGAGQAQT